MSGIRKPIQPKAINIAKVPEAINLSLLELATLLYNVHRGVETAEVGYEDHEKPLAWLVEQLSKKRQLVSTDALERALWSCVQLEEHAPLTGGFWSPKGEGVDDFVKRMLEGAHVNTVMKFDKEYCLFRSLKR